jgi:hypothetical protein
LKQFLFEEMRRIYLLWKIVEYRASLLKTCTASVLSFSMKLY